MVPKFFIVPTIKVGVYHDFYDQDLEVDYFNNPTFHYCKYMHKLQVLYVKN